ncbi:interferon regulatory factor 1 [Pelodytes ibericus]
MPVTRLRMRPWLEKQIESNAIPGLAWVNKDEKLFQIPWKHAARQGWDINKDACLFRSWAVHTGRYKEGQKEPDPKTWKANFRCAMNSLPDIKEVKDKSIYKGSTAVRVYRMLPPQIKTERKERKSKSLKDGKNRLNKKVSDSSQEDVEEVVQSQLLGDHSYTSASYTEQEIDIPGADMIGLIGNDVTSSIEDWKSSMDIQLPDSTNDIYSFQVSPCSSEEEEEGIKDDIFRILAHTSEWQQTNIDGKGYFTNDSSNILGEQMYEDLSKVSGEIELRFCTDMKTGFDILNFMEPAITRSAGLPAICSL